MKRRNFILACLLLLALPLSAAKVDTLMVKSPSMNKEVQVVVVTPDVASGKQAVECPVLYLLHRSEERRVGKECRSRWSPYH